MIKDQRREHLKFVFLFFYFLNPILHQISVVTPFMNKMFKINKIDFNDVYFENGYKTSFLHYNLNSFNIFI